MAPSRHSVPEEMCTAKCCALYLVGIVVCALILTATTAWSIWLLMDYDSDASHTAVLMIAACATLCVFWLCAGLIRRALMLWLACAMLFGAWYQIMLLPNTAVGTLNAVMVTQAAEH